MSIADGAQPNKVGELRSLKCNHGLGCCAVKKVTHTSARKEGLCRATTPVWNTFKRSMTDTRKQTKMKKVVFYESFAKFVGTTANMRFANSMGHGPIRRPVRWSAAIAVSGIAWKSCKW